MLDNVKNEEVKIIGKVEIFLLSNGEVQVKGPLKNSLIMMDVFGKALLAVANFTANEMKDCAVIEQPNIILPK